LDKAITSFALGEYYLKNIEKERASKAFEESQQALRKIPPLAHNPIFRGILETSIADRLADLSSRDSD